MGERRNESLASTRVIFEDFFVATIRGHLAHLSAFHLHVMACSSIALVTVRSQLSYANVTSSPSATLGTQKHQISSPGSGFLCGTRSRTLLNAPFFALFARFSRYSSIMIAEIFSEPAVDVWVYSLQRRYGTSPGNVYRHEGDGRCGQVSGNGGYGRNVFTCSSEIGR